MSKVLQFRVSDEEERILKQRSAERGTTLSETIRQDLRLDESKLTPLEKFEFAQKRAQAEINSSGIAEISEEEIVAYCAAARRERAQEAMRSYA